MAKKTVPVVADIVMCAVDVIAAAGEHLLIWQGVCIGVYDQHGDTAADTAGASPAKQTRRNRNQQRPLADDVVLSAAPVWRNVREICDNLGIDRKDTATRSRITRQLNRLAAVGAAQKDQTGACKRYPAYRRMIQHNGTSTAPPTA